MLMDYLFEEEKRDQAFEDIQKVAASTFDRQILIDQMIDLSINLKGDIKEQVKDLYIRLGLKSDSMKKANSRKWHKNVKGIRELAFMNIRDANDLIIKSLNSNNEILRMEAQIAMVRLSEENPYEFLHLLEKPLAVWEQITLHEMLIQHNLKVPAFKQWFESDNISILVYALEMVAWFKQKGVGKEVISLFTHEEEKVRYTALRVAGDIRLKSSLPAMKKVYAEESIHNKLEILKAFARMPDEKNLKFLKSILDTEEDVQLQIQATKAIENMDEPGISMLIKLMKSKSEYKNYQIIIRHVLDGRIY
jgi:HEAT repeat protein